MESTIGSQLVLAADIQYWGWRDKRRKNKKDEWTGGAKSQSGAKRKGTSKCKRTGKHEMRHCSGCGANNIGESEGHNDREPSWNEQTEVWSIETNNSINLHAQYAVVCGDCDRPLDAKCVQGVVPVGPSCQGGVIFETRTQGGHSTANFLLHSPSPDHTAPLDTSTCARDEYPARQLASPEASR